MPARLFRNLLLIFLFPFSSLLSQTLYWVGGSGNWNDPHHWSLSSGGSPVNKVPDVNTDVVFDDKSSSSQFVVNIAGENFGKTLSSFVNYNSPLIFNGDALSKLVLSGSLHFSAATTYKAKSSLIFNSSQLAVNLINFGVNNTLSANVYFKSGSFSINPITISGNNSVFFEVGTYNFVNSSIVTGNLYSRPNSKFNIKNSVFKVNNTCEIPAGTIFNSSKFTLLANVKDRTKFKVNSSLGLGSKVTNPQQIAACDWTVSTTPACSPCTGVLSVTLSGCTAGPYTLSALSPVGCNNPDMMSANNIPLTVYTATGVCACGSGNYALALSDSSGNIVQFQNNVNFLPNIPTLISNTVQPSCSGFCNGQLSGTLFGDAPFTVSVSPSASTFTTNSTFTVTNLCAATHTLTVTDKYGCVTTFTRILGQPNPLVHGGTTASISCNGVCTGSVNVSPTGGTPNYTVTWSSGPPTVTLSAGGSSSKTNLCIGAISATVTDSKGCLVVYNTSIVQPPALTVTATHTNATCGGTCNATASVSVTGGTPTYSYSWLPAGGTGSVATGLCGTLGATSPNHTVTITDGNGCVRTRTFTITEPPTLSLSPTFTNATCNGTCNGVAISNASGGNGSYTYSWVAPPSTTIANTSSVTGLCGGFPTPIIYTIAITDASLCATSSVVAISQPPSFSLSVNTTSVSCNGLCTGAATAVVGGGTAGYTYTWTAPTVSTGTNPSISNLCANNYTVNIRDANNCPANVTFTVTQPPPIGLGVTSTSITCTGLCNGSINSVPTGGTGPYTFTLTGPTAATSTTASPPYTNLCAGTYTVRVLDAAGCSTTQIVTLNQPNTFTLSLTTTSISCFGQCNANLTGNISGGTPTYTFSWSTPSGTLTGPALTNQCAGPYTLTVTDANGCNTSTAVTITQPTSITIGLTPNSPNCNGQCNGSITSTVTGGTPGYTLNWTGGGSGGTLSNICAGNYTLSVTDSRGCVSASSTTVVPTPSITITTTAIPVSCSGMCNGQAIATATGGNGTFTYSWSPAAQTGTSTAANLCPGNQSLTVTDNLGCIGSAVVTVTAPAVLSAAITGFIPSCNVCIGAATVVANGGTGPYNYSWTPSPGTGSSTPTPSNMCVGIHTVFVTDASGCTVSTTVNIPQTVLLNITTNGTTLTCNGGCTGIANANASGGTTPYTYTWTNSVPAVVSNTNTATGLCAGIYTVTVADANTCSNTGTISFANPPAITVTPTQTNAACNATCNGIISSPASGGTGSITYSWSPPGTGGNTPTVSNLCAGVYSLTVIDGNNCSTMNSYTITQPNAISATFTPFPPSICSGTNGAITTTVTGGTPSYTYNWNPTSATTASIGGLTAGSYSLTVNDAAGCTTTLVASLSDPTGPALTVTSTSVSCNSLCNGSATVSAVGTGPMTYTWSTGGSSTFTVGSLCQGTFAVNVTDQSVLCTTSQTFNITQPPSFTMNPIPLNPTCGGTLCNGSINSTPAGGTGPYTFTLSFATGSLTSNPPYTGLCGGAYTLGVTDNNSCNYAQSFTLTQPPAVTLTVNQTDVLCFGQCNGSITAVASGGTAGYTYTWTGTAPFPPTPLPNIVNLCPDTYTLSVLDGNNCPSSTTVQIIEPPLLTTTLTSQNAICSGSCNGSATITPSGGTPNYSYSWTGSISSVSLATGLCAGNYTATVTDANGCTSAQGYTITQPAPVNVTLTPTNPLCNTGCNGIITTSVTGGNGAYTYSLIPTGISTPTATGLCAASYTMLVFDGNSCPGQAITSLVSPPALLANVSTTNAACGAVCNGIASSNPINGTPSYTYTWTNSTSTFTGQTITNLCADNYTVMITDANSCTATQQFTLSTPPPLTITPSSAPATCSLVPCDGSITLVASGGTPGYSYSWTPAVSTGSVANNVCAGVYTVVVTDLNTCSNTFQVPLSNSNGPTGAAVTSSNVICNGQCNGVASVDAPITGGTSPYTVTWISTGTWTPATSPTTMPQSNLCANTYTAQIVDANTCQFYVPVTITEPAPFLDNSSLGAPICNGICNGAIAVTPSGGTPSYTFSWSTGAVVTGTTTSLNGLCTGAYSLTVQDANLCTYTVGYVMPSLTSITANTTSINNTCFGDCNGVINVVNLVGGTPGYTFNWSDPLGQSTQQATGLCNGNYFVVVTDAVGCFDTIRGLISSAPAITMTSSVTEPACGLCNGTATVGASGGTAPYTYAWSTSTSGPTASNLCAGLYVLTITDSQGCFENINLPVSNSTGITGEIISTTDETCPDLCDGSATVTAVGGTAPITYFWPSTAVSTNTINNLCGGNSYFVQMQDAVGCIRTTSVTINSNSDFTVTPFISQPSCTVNNGSIIVNVTGSPGPFSYAWNPVALNSPTLNNIPSGTYTLVVTNTVTGCSKTSVYNVTSVNAPVVSVLSNDASCNGSCNGSASFIVNSGSAGFTYTWSTGSTGNIASIGGSSSITNLCGGVVTFTLDGADGCRLTQNLTINQPNSVALSLPVINTPDCNNDCNGSINLVPSGGSLPYTYSWSPGASTLNPASGLCAGPGSNTIYSVTVTDANGCTDTMSINLINPAPLVLTTSITPSSCNNTSDAVITSTVTGGLPVYTYTWTGPAAFTSTNSSVSGLAPGVYSLQLADFSGCQQSTTLQVVSNVTVIAVAGNDSTFCQNGAFSLDGSASVSSPTATYGWYQLPSASPFSNAITVPVTPPIGTTTFVLMVQENGCTDSDTLSLTSNVPPVVDAGPNFTLTIYTSTVIGGSPTSATGVSYTWSPAFSLDNANIPNPTASNTVNTAYTVTVTDANGCTASDTMHVHIFPDIIIPNGFSPNGDGKNDTWIIDNIEQFPDCVVEVYNRWGELLFMSKGYVNKWDGKYNGKDLPVGTYYYIINLNHEFFPNPYTGPITIFR